MKEDLTKLTKAQLIERLNQTSGGFATSVAPAASPDSTIRDFASAVATHLREGAAPTEDNTLYPVTNVVGMAIAFELTDAKTHQPRIYRMEKRGDVVHLTRHQIGELQDLAPHFFPDGYLKTPIIAETMNHIGPFKAFVESLRAEDINARIEAIDSPDVLLDLYNWLENQRWSSFDEKGEPVTMQNSVGMPVESIREVVLPQQYMAVLLATARRYTALSGAQLRIN